MVEAGPISRFSVFLVCFAICFLANRKAIASRYVKYFDYRNINISGVQSGLFIPVTICAIFGAIELLFNIPSPTWGGPYFFSFIENESRQFCLELQKTCDMAFYFYVYDTSAMGAVFISVARVVIGVYEYVHTSEDGRGLPITKRDLPISIVGDLTIDKSRQAWKIVSVFAVVGMLFLAGATYPNLILRVPPLHFILRFFPGLISMYMCEFFVAMIVLSGVAIIYLQFMISSNWSDESR